MVGFVEMDTLTRSERRERMRRILSKDTAPEMVVRHVVYSLGYRYRLHVTSLPGRPDLVFSSRQRVIFVNGCFWHRHRGCRLARLPKSRLDFWLPKLEANRLRDRRNVAALRARGWRALVLWECQLSDVARLSRRLTRFLGPVM